MKILPTRRPLALLTLGLFLFGCEAGNPSASEETNGNVPDLSDAVPMFYGVPDGESPVVGMAGVYTKEEFNAPEAQRTRAAIPVVTITLANLVLEAASWETADQKVRAYLAEPPADAHDLPSYLIEQTAAQCMVRYSDLLTSTADTPRHRDVVSYYLDLLVKNRFPDPGPVAKMFEIVGDDWSRARVANAAASTMAAHALYLERREAKFEKCPLCRRSFELRPSTAKLEIEWDDALADLSALAQR